MDNQITQKLNTFFQQFKKQTYKKGEILIRADDTPRGIFYLTNGSVRVYAISRKGDELVVNIFKPIAFFPMSWAINNTDNRYYYEAMTEVSVWRAPKDAVIAFLKQEPDVLFNLMSRVYRGVDGVLTRMTYLMAGNAYGRLVTELLIYAKRFGEGKQTVTVAISEKDLASQSGMTRETINREMKNLKEKGFVSVDKNKITITNLQKLEEELADGV